MTKLTQPPKWHGGKHYLAGTIVELMPPHGHYVEPYFGGGSVLLAKDPINVSEVVNDKNLELTNFWRVLQDPDLFEQFIRVVEATPFSQQEWRDAEHVCSIASPDVDAAVAFFVRCRQSRAGKFDAFATLSKNRTRRKMNEQVSAWLTAVEGLPAVARRLQRVVVLNDDAVKIIGREDSAKTLFYLDPPYLHETRVTTSDYECEMTVDEHCRLLDAVGQVQGKVLLSGYPSELYDGVLKDWNRKSITIDNKAS
ncbi:MAG: DNA adenine methylase, partial [Planctomycetales bacterium]